MAAMAALRAQWVPEALRATLYNLLRIPLNLLVVCLSVASLSSEFTFGACAGLTAVALGGALGVRLLRPAQGATDGGKGRPLL